MHKVTLGLAIALLAFLFLSLTLKAQPLPPDPPLPFQAGETAAGVSQEPTSLSFSIGRTFGITGTPYLSNTSYLNYPYGIVADGSTVWIVESSGRQLVQFSDLGVVERIVGRTGMLDYNGTTLCWLADAALDPDGHLWVVDQCASHVVEFDVEGNVLQELGQTWSGGAGNDQFQRPMGVAVDSQGNVYVSDGSPPWNSDEGNHRIQIYDAYGNYLHTIGTTGAPGTGDTTFHGPRYLAIDAADRLYVADSGNHRVQILDVSEPLTPTYVTTLGVTGISGSDNAHLNSPSGVTVAGSSILVADTHNHRVQVYDRDTFAYQATLGTGAPGAGADQFREPVDVAVDSAGYIYVVDAGNIRVERFNSSYAYRGTFGTTQVPYLTDGLHYHHPAGVAIDPADDSIYLVEEEGQRLVKLDASGNFLWAAGEPGVKGGDNAHFHYPRDVAVDDRGSVYVADALNHRVQIYSAGGTYSTTLGSQGDGDYQFDTPSGLTIAPDGLLYVADSGNHRVKIYDRNLNYVDLLHVTAEGPFWAPFPEDVAVDTRGYIYVADGSDAQVWVLGPALGEIQFIGDRHHPMPFSYPARLATDLSDNLYVLDVGQNCVYRFHWNEHPQLDTIGEWGHGPGQFNNPYGLAIDSRGGLYVGDRKNQRVQEFVRSGPSIIRTYPFSDTLDVLPQRWVSVAFDDAIAPDTLNSTTFRLYQAGTSPVDGNINYVGASRMAIFQPAVELAPNTRYTVEVTTGVHSVYAKPLKQGRTWSFTTGDGPVPLAEDMYFFFGDLHSHSGYSDGEGVPAEVYLTARGNGRDFYALTDHAFQLTPAEWQDMGEQAGIASISGKFAGLRGFEYTHNDAGHLNVFGTATYVHRDDPEHDTLGEFYTWLAAQPQAIGQFNHPFSHADFNDFAYHAGAARRMALVEHVGVDASFDWLAAGWHVGLVTNSDTHHANWGAWRGAGVVAPELTPEAILDALRARRIFDAWTSGPDVGLAMRVNGHWMGEVITATGTLDVEVTLYAPNSEGYVHELVLYDNGVPVDSIVPPLPWEPLFTWDTTVRGTPGHYYYAQATMTDKNSSLVYPAYTAPVWTTGRVVYLPLVIKN